MSPGKQAVAQLDIFSSSGQTIIPATARIIREVALTVGIDSQTIATIACMGDHLEELAAIDDFDEGRAFAKGGDHPDGGRVLDADALAKGVVGLDQAGQCALRVDGKG